MYGNTPIGVTCANSIECISKLLPPVWLCIVLSISVTITHAQVWYIRFRRFVPQRHIFFSILFFQKTATKTIMVMMLIMKMMSNEHLDRKKVQITKLKSLQSRCFDGLYVKIFEG